MNYTCKHYTRAIKLQSKHVNADLQGATLTLLRRRVRSGHAKWLSKLQAKSHFLTHTSAVFCASSITNDESDHDITQLVYKSPYVGSHTSQQPLAQSPYSQTAWLLHIHSSRAPMFTSIPSKDSPTYQLSLKYSIVPPFLFMLFRKG